MADAATGLLSRRTGSPVTLFETASAAL